MICSVTATFELFIEAFLILFKEAVPHVYDVFSILIANIIKFQFYQLQATDFQNLLIIRQRPGSTGPST